MAAREFTVILVHGEQHLGKGGYLCAFETLKAA
jgi:hypothetical protein